MDKLPTEVLAEIVELLRDDRKDLWPRTRPRSESKAHSILSDLWSISYTNRKLHAIANDIIYSHYELYYQETSLFIRALASNPNLQRCVQHIKWNSPIHCEGAFEFPRRITEAEFDQIKEKVGFPFPAAWPRHATFLNGKMVELNNWMRLRTESDLYLSTFMLFTPNVKELYIFAKHWESEGMWFKQSLIGKIGTNLQKVIFDGGANVVNLLPLFLLPNMKTLLVSDLLETSLYEDAELEASNLVWARLEKEGSNLEHLEIFNITADVLDLARLLKSLKNLKVLDYKWGCGAPVKKDNRDVQTLFEAIGNHCASLNNMAIDDPRLVTNPGALEQLRGLENVETFQMTTPIFYEKVHCRSVTKEFLAESLQRNLGNLPKHLKNLRISTKAGYHDLTETCFDVLPDLASDIKTLLPDLETITFYGWHPQLGTFPCQTRIAALQSAFAQVGVKIVSEHDTIGDSERWYTKTRVGASSKIEEDYVWVQFLGEDEGEGENPWVARFGSSYRGDELNGDVWDSDEEEEGVDDDQEEGEGDEEEEDGNEDEWEDEEDNDETPNPSAGGRPLNMQDIMEEMGILAAQGRMPGMPGMQPMNDDNEESGDDGEEGSNTEFGPGRPLTMQDIENEMRIMMGQGLIFNLPGMPGYRPEGGDGENEEDDDDEDDEEGSNDGDGEQDENDTDNADDDNDNDPPPALEPLPSASNLTLQEIDEKMKTMMAEERMFKLPGMPHFNPEDQYDSEEDDYDEDEDEEEDEDDDDDDGNDAPPASDAQPSGGRPLTRQDIEDEIRILAARGAPRGM